MKDNYLKINDLIEFDFLSPELIRVKDDFDNKTGPFEVIEDFNIKTADAKGLKVRLSATHAGVVTKNNMFYLPDKMKRGTATLLEDYGKPFLKHHDSKQDAIGRIIDAKYIDTSGVIKDNMSELFMSDSSSMFSEKNLKDFCEGKMPFGLQIDFVRNYFNKPIKDGESFLENSVYRGLGHIQIIADITDPDAIQKFLDGRYLTGSIGARTNRAVCSICKQDYTKFGECEHTPGAEYDGQKCVLIAGDFFYDEYSVVNNPADRQSRVLELYYNGSVKNIEVKNESVGDAYEVKLGFPQYEKEEELMKDKANKAEDTTKVSKEEIKVQDSEKESKEDKVEPKDDSQKDIQVKDVDESETKTELSFEDKLVILMDKEEFEDGDEGKLYDMMFEDQEDVQESKLTIEKRKSLSKSTFCGPNRSFPVPDRAHYIAALRLLDKYKGSKDKAELKKSIERKGKAKGWAPKKTKDAIAHAQVLQMLTQTVKEHLYTKKWREEDGNEPVLSEDDISALSVVMKNLVMMVGKDSFVASLSADEKELKSIVKRFQDVDLLDEIISLEENLGSIRDELADTSEERDALKEEYELIQNDNDSIRDELVGEKQKIKDFQVDKLCLFKSLKDGVVEDSVREELFKLSDEVLEVELTKLTEEVDIKKMADKLNDGMSRRPEGDVKDPTVSFEDSCSKEMKDEIEKIERIMIKTRFRSPQEGLNWKALQIKNLESKMGKGSIDEEK